MQRWEMTQNSNILKMGEKSKIPNYGLFLKKQRLGDASLGSKMGSHKIKLHLICTVSDLLSGE